MASFPGVLLLLGDMGAKRSGRGGDLIWKEKKKKAVARSEIHFIFSVTSYPHVRYKKAVDMFPSWTSCDDDFDGLVKWVCGHTGPSTRRTRHKKRRQKKL